MGILLKGTKMTTTDTTGVRRLCVIFKCDKQLRQQIL